VSACDSIAVVGVAVTDVVTAAAAAEADALVDRSTQREPPKLTR
jgi:hypothetical protein